MRIIENVAGLEVDVEHPKPVVPKDEAVGISYLESADAIGDILGLRPAASMYSLGISTFPSPIFVAKLTPLLYILLSLYICYISSSD